MIAKTITVYDMGRFDSKFAALNKKVVKMGLSPLVKGGVSHETKTVKNRFGESVEAFSHYEVLVSMPEEIVSFPGGWSLVAVIDHKEGLTKSVPDTADIPLRYYVERGAVCDHCGTERSRNETFIVLDDTGALVQVGRQCVGELLGISPERALGQVEVVKELLADEEWLGQRQSLGTPLSFYLSHVAAMVRTTGWRSRKSFQENPSAGPATADQASSNIDYEERKVKSNWGEPLWTERTQGDIDMAHAVVAWMVGLSDRKNLSDYMSNLAQIGLNSFVTGKSMGFAASAVVAYQKEQEEEVKRAAVRASTTKQYVGEVGKRITVQAHKVSSAGFETEWGYTFFHRFVDTSGNIIVWKTSSELDNGAYALTGTVKSHEDYKGEPQTYLTRCKVGLADKEKVA